MSSPTHVDIRSILTGAETTPEWLVEDIFYKGQMICLAGAPGVGKSFLSNTLAMSVACGLPFLGKPSTQGRVLYFDEENSLPDFRQYLRWVWHGIGSPDINQIEASCRWEHFSLVSQLNRFSYMREKAAEFSPDLIIIDTATTVCGIKEENDNAEASRIIRQLRGVQHAAGPKATMLVLKHEKFTHEIGEARTIRGAKTWLGEVDMVAYHVGAVGRPRKDGLRDSQIVPDKVRAFGLKSTIKIFPAHINGGIRLSTEKPHS